MISDHNGELNSPSDVNQTRLPSLIALRCFEAAARLENFTRAAEELHLTHGAISRAVRMLEDDLGVALFERRSRRVFLTQEGRSLAQAVHEGLTVMQRAISELRARARQQRRWVVSCEPTLLMRWLIPRWPAFQAKHPDRDIHLVAGGGAFSFHAGIDLAIRRDDFPLPDGYHAEHLFSEKVGPVCRPDKIDAWFSTGEKGLLLRDDAPRLHSRTRLSAWDTWSEITQHPFHENSGQTFEHFYFSLQAAVAGLGVAIGPWQLVRDDIASGVLVAPLGFVEEGSCYCLLSPSPLFPDTFHADLLAWLRSMA